jgi:hypothetical protein
MGQIYSRKRYQLVSDWYKNDQLLDEMYKFLDNLTKCRTGARITITKTSHIEVKFSDNTDYIVNDPVNAGALEDLVFYLEKLRFLKKDGDSYEIKGKFVGKAHSNFWSYAMANRTVRAPSSTLRNPNPALFLSPIPTSSIKFRNLLLNSVSNPLK